MAKTIGTIQASTLTPVRLIARARNTRVLGDGPIRMRFVKGRGRLVVVLGENATGKSLFRRVIAAICSQACKPKVECIHVSMEGRAGPDYSGGVRSFIYGSEEWNATGVNTGHLVTTGISTSLGRENPHVLFWDEPDTGLSDDYAADAGHRIAQHVLSGPKHLKAAFVVTHRRALVGELLIAEPHALFFGEKQWANIASWLVRPVKRKNLEELYERSHKLFQQVTPLLKGK